MEWMSLVGNIGLQAGSATLKVVIVTRDQTIKSTAKDRIPLLSMQAEISAVMERGTVSASRLACEILQAKQYHLMEIGGTVFVSNVVFTGTLEQDITEEIFSFTGTSEISS